MSGERSVDNERRRVELWEITRPLIEEGIINEVDDGVREAAREFLRAALAWCRCDDLVNLAREAGRPPEVLAEREAAREATLAVFHVALGRLMVNMERVMAEREVNP